MFWLPLARSEYPCQLGARIEFIRRLCVHLARHFSQTRPDPSERRAAESLSSINLSG